MLGRLAKALGRPQLVASIATAQRVGYPSNVSSSVYRAFSSSMSHEPNLDWVNSLRDKELFKQQCFIGGEWVDAGDGETLDVINPATGVVIARVPKMKGAETNTAIAEAATVFPTWAAETAKERARIMKKWYQLVSEAADDIAIIMTIECGKPLAESKAEITGGASSIEWFAEEGKRVEGDVLEPPSKDRRFLVLKQPVGVVAAITPWNFPMSMITRKVSPAIAAGCPVILKPAEQTPLTALALAELGRRAGLPPGVLNILTGDPILISGELMRSETVRKIGFTGSTRVGKLLMKQAADTVKKMSMELGGNAPYIVFNDADLELAAKGVVGSAFRNAGQTCICANRIFVQSGVYEEFTALLTEKVANLRMGEGIVEGITLGPLISADAVDRVQGHIDDAVRKGAKVTTGGNRGTGNDLEKGFFHEATVLRDATIDMKIFREETFGPAVPVFKFDTEAEAVTMANDTEYGLAAYFFTKDLARSWRVAEALEYGMVGLNDVMITDPVAPFGGMKQSGLGREHSKYGISEFLDVKFVSMGLGYSGANDY